MYSEVTQDVICSLEECLLDDWQLDDYASHIGYSKFHLSRIFKQETGLTISEYIRKRRLATAAMYLLYSDESILQIAFELRYQSQEASHVLLKSYIKCHQANIAKSCEHFKGRRKKI